MKFLIVSIAALACLLLGTSQVQAHHHRHCCCQRVTVCVAVPACPCGAVCNCGATCPCPGCPVHHPENVAPACSAPSCNTGPVVATPAIVKPKVVAPVPETATHHVHQKQNPTNRTRH
jgi:hypothetical protein